MELYIKSGGKDTKIRVGRDRICTVPNVETLRLIYRCLGVCSYTKQFMLRVLYESEHRSVSEYIDEYKQGLFNWFCPVCYKDGRKFMSFAWSFDNTRNSITFGPLHGNNSGVDLSDNLENAIKNLIETTRKFKFIPVSYYDNLNQYKNNLSAVLSNGYHFGFATNPMVYVPKDRDLLSQLLSGINNTSMVELLSSYTEGVLGVYLNSCVLPMVCGVQGYPCSLLDEGFSIVDAIYRQVYSPIKKAEREVLEGHISNMLKLAKELIGGDLRIKNEFSHWKIVTDDSKEITSVSKEKSYLLWLVASIIITVTLSMYNNVGYSLLIENAELGLSAKQVEIFNEFIREFLYIHPYNRLFIHK